MVRAVGHVGGVGLAALAVVELVHDAPDLEPQEAVDLPHPLGVALGEIVVHGDDVHTLALERVQIDRECRHQRLAFAGLHLRDHAAVEHDAAHELDVEVALSQGALGGLADGGEGVDQEVVELLAVLEPTLEPRRALGERFVRQLLELGLELVDGIDKGLEALDVTVVRGAKQSPGESA